jgi:hypothetical protein
MNAGARGRFERSSAASEQLNRREVVTAAHKELQRRTNFVRPSIVKLEAAEAFSTQLAVRR